MSVYIEIVHGDHEELDFEFFDEAGIAVDITGSTIFFTVKEELTDDDEDAIFQKIVTTHSDPEEGESTVVLTNADTSLPEMGRSYYFDMQIVDSNTLRHTPVVGSIVFTNEVTLT